MDNIFGPEMSFTSTTGLSLGTRPISQTFFGAVRWHIRYIREVKSFFYTHAVSQYLINSFSVISLWFCWVSSCKFILHSVSSVCVRLTRKASLPDTVSFPKWWRNLFVGKIKQ